MAVRSQRTMANQYETFRDTIKASLCKNCVKTSQDASAIIYDWSMDKAFRTCGEACQMPDVKKLPDDFKSIVRFEFNKLKDEVLNNPKWTQTKSRETWVFNADGVGQNRTDTFKNTALALDEKITGAVIVLSKTEKMLAAADRGTKRFQQLRRKANALRGELDFLREEKQRQAELSKESLEAASKLEVPANA